MIANRYPGKCQSCEQNVAVGQGFAYKNGYRWLTVCKSTACMRRLGLTPPNGNGGVARREITADGKVIMPFDREALPLLRSMPGARWNPEDKAWTVSVKPGDLRRVVEVADLLHLTIPVSLRQQAEEGTPEMREAKKRASRQGLYEFQRVGVEFLALHERALLADDMGTGKMQPVTEPVLTPDGWKSIGEIKVGDLVVGSSGTAVQVTGVFPQGIKDVFEVVFSDGASTRCGGDHLWAVQTPNDRVRNPGKLRIHSLNSLSEIGVYDHNGNSKWFIPLVQPVEFKDKDFPLHPYLLGALIANGHFSNSVSHSGDEEQRNALRPYLPAGLSLVQCGGTDRPSDYRITHGQVGQENEVLSAIKGLGLHRVNSPEKFIPEIYLLGSAEQRLALLQGLVDNDGTVSKNGVFVEYNTTSPVLAEQVIGLVQSLGGTACAATRTPKYVYQKQVKEGRKDHRIHIKLPGSMCPVTIPRKKERFVNPTKYPVTRSIVSIRRLPDEESVCIMVDAEDHLYVTKDYILTHNTVQTLVALPDNPRVIAIVPAAVKYNWQDEAEKWRPDIKVTVLSGRGSFKLPEPGEMIIVNYDILPEWLSPPPKSKEALVTPEQKAALKQCILIADECHLVKNYKAKRSKRVATLSKLCAKTWFLTGTPLMNRPTDLYGVLSSGGMYVLGGWQKFVDLFNGFRNKWGGYEFGLPKPEVPERMKRVMLRRTKEEVLPDLPEKTYQVIPVNDLDKKLKKELDQKLIDIMLDSGFTKKEANEMVHNFERLVASVKALNTGAVSPDQIEEFTRQKELLDAVNQMAMPNFEQFSEIRARLAEARIPAVVEIVESYEESDTPLVVFSAHKAPVKVLGDREGWDCITGDTPPKERRDIVKAFQSGQLKGVACTVQAGGVGITLTRASTALFVDLDWTPAWNLQAEDRLRRIGQTKKVLIQHLQSNHPLDKHIQKLIRYKMELMQKSLDENIKFKPPRNFDKPAPDVVEESDEELAARLAALEEAEKEAERQVACDRIHSILSREQAKSDVPEPELTPKRKQLIKDALAFMVARCDGAIEKDYIGFNRPDACIAHWIFATGLRDDDEVTFRVTERILSRYYRQLNEQFGAIWTPEMR